MASARSRTARRPASPTRAGDLRYRLRFRPEPGGGPGGANGCTARTPTILVVDDEPAIRTICRVNLEAAGMEILEAADGEEALATIRAERPALVLLDVMMPRADGWLVAERLGADPATRDIPIVFLSARAGAEELLQAHGLGAVGYLVKPFDPIALPQTLATVLERIARGERERLRTELLAEL